MFCRGFTYIILVVKKSLKNIYSALTLVNPAALALNLTTIAKLKKKKKLNIFMINLYVQY